MFTGLITHIAKVVVFKNQNANSVELGVLVNNLDISDIKLGESIALNGVCLTVSSIKYNILYRYLLFLQSNVVPSQIHIPLLCIFYN